MQGTSPRLHTAIRFDLSLISIHFKLSINYIQAVFHLNCLFIPVFLACQPNLAKHLILHVARNDTFQFDAPLTRRVSEGGSCSPSLTLRVSVRPGRAEYSSAIRRSPNRRRLPPRHLQNAAIAVPEPSQVHVRRLKVAQVPHFGQLVTTAASAHSHPG